MKNLGASKSHRIAQKLHPDLLRLSSKLLVRDVRRVTGASYHVAHRAVSLAKYGTTGATRRVLD